MIPNWNGRDLLEKYLPSVIAATRDNPANEIIVVDNGSTDGSADFVRERFPQVRLLALETQPRLRRRLERRISRRPQRHRRSAEQRHARRRRISLRRCSTASRDDRVFAVSCQIFFSDPARVREETGLTQARWHEGALRVRHRIDDSHQGLFPCFYAGGGSSAFDRRKFLELGGFDPLLAPFYLEDTDLGYMAWKRGWKVLYQPRSVVYHEHRGTIGRHFSAGIHSGGLQEELPAVRVEEHPRMARRPRRTSRLLSRTSLLSALFGDVPRAATPPASGAPALQLPQALGARWRARSLAIIGDTEAFRRPLAGYFRDRFVSGRPAETPEKPRVLFLSPYPIHPPVHGGAVFMNATLRELARRAEVHLVSMLDRADQLEANRELASLLRLRRVRRARRTSSRKTAQRLRSERRARVRKRRPGMARAPPDLHARDRRGAARVHADGAVRGPAFENIANVLFEHDVYFQSIARGLKGAPHATAAFEYLRALRYELQGPAAHGSHTVPAARRTATTCSAFLPGSPEEIQSGLRAAIDVSELPLSERRPRAVHDAVPRQLSPPAEPGRAGSGSSRRCCRGSSTSCPQARLVVVGSEMQANQALPLLARHRSARLRGGCARAAVALRRLRLPGVERLGSPCEAARSLRLGHSRGLDATRRGGPGAQGRRVLLAGRRAPEDVRPPDSRRFSRSPKTLPRWPSGPVARSQPNWNTRHSDGAVSSRATATRWRKSGRRTRAAATSSRFPSCSSAGDPLGRAVQLCAGCCSSAARKSTKELVRSCGSTRNIVPFARRKVEAGTLVGRSHREAGPIFLRASSPASAASFALCCCGFRHSSPQAWCSWPVPPSSVRGASGSGFGSGNNSVKRLSRASPNAVRQHRIGFVRIRHYAEHAQIRQAIRQVLIETVGHGQQIDGVNTSDLGVHRARKRARTALQPTNRAAERLHDRYHNMRSSGRREASSRAPVRYHYDVTFLEKVVYSQSLRSVNIR